jgi:hypothetical protein
MWVAMNSPNYASHLATTIGGRRRDRPWLTTDERQRMSDSNRRKVASCRRAVDGPINVVFVLSGALIVSHAADRDGGPQAIVYPKRGLPLAELHGHTAKTARSPRSFATIRVTRTAGLRFVLTDGSLSSGCRARSEEPGPEQLSARG